MMRTIYLNDIFSLILNQSYMKEKWEFTEFQDISNILHYKNILDADEDSQQKKK